VSLRASGLHILRRRASCRFSRQSFSCPTRECRQPALTSTTFVRWPRLDQFRSQSKGSTLYCNATPHASPSCSTRSCSFTSIHRRRKGDVLHAMAVSSSRFEAKLLPFDTTYSCKHDHDSASVPCTRLSFARRINELATPRASHNACYKRTNRSDYATTTTAGRRLAAALSTSCPSLDLVRHRRRRTLHGGK
jgi:hypothetical protein